jgi:hypothetical protein
MPADEERDVWEELRESGERLRRRIAEVRAYHEDLRRSVRGTRRECARFLGEQLGRDLPDPEPEITNQLWFDFLTEHPELTGWHG